MRKLVLVLLALVALAFAQTLTVVNSFASPDIYPNGLAWDGASLWLNGGSNDGFYELDPTTGATLSSFFPSEPGGDNAMGCAFDGTNLWGNYLYDTGSPADVYEYTTAGVYQSDFAGPANYGTGLTFDGTYLWYAASTPNTIYQVDTSGSLISSFTFPGSGPRGLGYDLANDVLWCGAGSTLYALQTDGTVIETYNLNSVAGGFSSAGVAFDGTYIWIAEQASDIIYQLEASGSAVVNTSFGEIKSLYAD